MSDKNFKIKPKVWPKEYTFEEFKQLNPTIAENLLINYYNKYLHEYAQDRSRHLNHFNDTKDNLSKELNLLNEKLINNISDWNDGDMNVGPTGAGRKYRSPLNQNTNSLTFDAVDDALPLNFIDEGRPPADGTLKPYKGLTVSAWVNLAAVRSSVADVPSVTTSTIFTVLAAHDSQTGYVLKMQNYRFIWQIVHDDGDGTGTSIETKNAYKQLSYDTRQQYRADGWHHIVGTWDGKKQILYIDGRLPTDDGTISSPNNNHTEHIWDVYDDYSDDGVTATDYQTTSGSVGAIYYANSGTGYLSNNHLVNVVIGARADTNTDGSHSLYTEYFSGSIAEVAIWDEALDLTTVNELYHNGISGSSPKFDLSYSGYNNGENNHNHPYDTYDEGLSYKNVGRYANSLQGWWRLEEGTGIVAVDSSGKNRGGDLVNSPTWSGNFTPGI